MHQNGAPPLPETSGVYNAKRLVRTGCTGAHNIAALIRTSAGVPLPKACGVYNAKRLVRTGCAGAHNAAALVRTGAGAYNSSLSGWLDNGLRYCFL